MVEVWLPYGNSEIPVRVPEERLQDILRPQLRTVTLDLVAETKRLLQSSGLVDAASRAERVCIATGVSSDQRVLVDLVKLLVEHLTASGLAEHSITILTTSPMQGRPISVEHTLSHDPASSPTSPFTDSKLDFPVALNSALLGSGLKILVGELRPHHFLGYAGVSDIVFPGSASADSIHSHLTNRKGGSVADLSAERLKVAESIPNLFALGYVLDGDHSPSQVAFGGIHECVDALKEKVQTTYCRTIRKPADIVVLSAGGAPLDESLALAADSIPAGVAASKRDGALIVAAECALGHGDGQFYEWCAERKEPRHLEARLRHNFTYDGFKAAFLKRTVESRRIYLVSTIADYYVERIFGMRPAGTVNAALQTAQRAIGTDSSITVIPDGMRVIPVHQQETV